MPKAIGSKGLNTLLSLCLLLVWSGLAQAEVAVPPLTGRVVDLTGSLSVTVKESLETQLRAYEDNKGSQLAVLIVPTTSPEEIEQYSIRVVDQWKLGRKKVDDGVLFIVSKDDRKMRIEVGRGLEGILQDITSSRIIREIITPHFKDGDFEGGIQAGVDAILKTMSGEMLPAPAKHSRNNSQGSGHLNNTFLIVALLAAFILRSALGKVFGSLAAGGAVALLSWFFLGSLFLTIFFGVIIFIIGLFLNSGGGGGMGGGFYGGGFGGGGFGGSSNSGGGFSGGGGSFGGGGSSGSW